MKKNYKLTKDCLISLLNKENPDIEQARKLIETMQAVQKFDSLALLIELEEQSIKKGQYLLAVALEKMNNGFAKLSPQGLKRIITINNKKNGSSRLAMDAALRLPDDEGKIIILKEVMEKAVYKAKIELRHRADAAYAIKVFSDQNVTVAKK